MEILVLKPEYIKAVRRDPILKGTIAAINKVHTATVDRWLRESADTLTTASSLNIIRERLKLDNSIELTEPQESNIAV